VTATIVVAVSKHSEKNYCYRKILFSIYLNSKVLVLKIPLEFKNYVVQLVTYLT